MLFTIHIDEKLDLTKFRKQAMHYIGKMREITYHIYLPNYKVVAEIVSVEDSSKHLVSMWITELLRDKDKEITGEKVVIPVSDSRFRDIKDVQSIFPIDDYKSLFESSSVLDTVNKICNLTKLAFKINNLLAYL
jgi:hypothetical protein